MDPSLVNLQFKPNKKGTAVIAYCEEYPEVQGNGPTEESATGSFWKAFSKRSAELELQSSKKAKAAKDAA